MKMNQFIASQIDEQNYRNRQALLRAIPKAKHIKHKKLATGLYASGVWNRDISILDKRSVKAHLAGNGDFRALWWKTFCALHRIFSEHSSLEWAMHDFHKMHHTITLNSLWFYREIDLLTASIIEQGIAKALTAHFKMTFNQKNIFSLK